MFVPTTVLGLDPGVATTGYAVVERAGSGLRLVEAGTVRTTAGLDLPSRLRTIFAEVGALIGRLRPQAAAVERVLFSANARTAMAVGQGSGVVLLAASEAGLPVEQYSPNEVKLAVTGYGGAPQAQVRGMGAARLPLPPPPPPPAPAHPAPLAICHPNARGLP